MQEKEDVSLVSDTVFKYMFNYPVYKEKMIKAIKRYTNIDLTDYKIINNEISSGTKRIKDFRMDIVLKKNSHIVIIEMEQSSTIAAEMKDYSYLYRIAGTQFESGKDYGIVKATLIRFDNFILKHDNTRDEVLVEFKLMNSKYNIIKEDIESFEIILPNYHKMNYNECNEIEKFLWLFSCKTIKEMKTIVDNDKDLKIINELERLSMDDDCFRFEYDYEKVQKKLLYSEKKEAFAEGVAEGAKEEQIRNIKAFYSNGVSIDLISKSVNLTIEEVKAILDKN